MIINKIYKYNLLTKVFKVISCKIKKLSKDAKNNANLVRFLLSLSSCQRCLVVDDQLTVLPISSHVLELEPVTREDVDSHTVHELEALKESLRDTQPVSSLLNCCRTLDQVLAQ